MKDIVERLRACPGLDDPECHCAEAADEIERLRGHRAIADMGARLQGERAMKAEAEIERLQAALEEAREFVDRHSEPWYTSGQELVKKLDALMKSPAGGKP